MSRQVWDQAAWRKSSRSNGDGDCVEVAVLPEWRTSSVSSSPGNCAETAGLSAWRKSSRSGANGDCVEVAALASAVGVRDSKDQAGPILVVPPDEWTAFLSAIRADTFHPTP